MRMRHRIKNDKCIRAANTHRRTWVVHWLSVNFCVKEVSITLHIGQDKLLPTKLINKVSECRESLPNLIIAMRMDHGAAKFLNRFRVARFYKPDGAILFR